jgi:hypothetical protein
MSEQDTLALDRIGHARTDFGKVESITMFPTRREIARTMFGIMFFLGVGLITIGLAALMR